MSAPEGEELALWRRYAAARDLDTRNRLVERHLELARTVAATLYARRGALPVEFGDYLQFATLGLVEAVDHYDAERGVAFASYASVRIRGTILNALEGLSERYQQLDLRRRLRDERLESLRAQPGGATRRDPFAELADIAVGLALSRLLEGSGMLHEPSGPDPAYRQEFYDTTQERQLRETMGALVQALPEQERRVVRYHYFQNVAFKDIAELLGVTRGRVSQIHRQALLLLRQARHGAPGLSLEL